MHTLHSCLHIYVRSIAMVMYNKAAGSAWLQRSWGRGYLGSTCTEIDHIIIL